jgi:hypothetical protein
MSSLHPAVGIATRLVRSVAVAITLAMSFEAGAQSAHYQFIMTPWDLTRTTPVLAFIGAGYGERSFRSVGADQFEPRMGAGVRLNERLFFRAGASAAPMSSIEGDHAAIEGELIVGLTPTTSPFQLTAALGGMRDYGGTGVALARFGAGWRSSTWNATANLRLERPFANESSERRDAVDVVTALGFMKRINGTLQVGFEGVGQDLEGFFDKMEAEGGARLMIGPALGIGSESSPWRILVGGGPVIRATNSAVASESVPRELQSRSGYIVRTSLSYRW